MEQKYDSAQHLTGSEKDKLRKKFGRNQLSGADLDKGRKSKSKALNKLKK